MNVLIAFPTIP